MSREFAIVLLFITLLFLFSYNEYRPLNEIMDWHSKRKSLIGQKSSSKNFLLYDYTFGDSTGLTIDVLKGEHFWNPQVAIWIEDSLGEHIKTLFVTNSTAKGLFFGGRTADNYKQYDSKKSNSKDFRRVNALPYWAFKRGVKAKDGFVVPHPQAPLPDAISGATPTNNFIIEIAPDSIFLSLKKFKILLEVNVAFDENEYYSEFDYLDDDQYHNGTGLLGQPSLVYEALIDTNESEKYYIMKLVGHGHHSSKNGDLFPDISTITTAKKILERVVVGIQF